MFIYYLHYFLVSFFSSLWALRPKSEYWIKGIVFTLLFVFAASRGAYVGRDYLVYVDYFERLGGSSYNYFTAESMAFYEPAFYIIPLVGKLLVGHYYSFFSFALFAILGTYYKLKAFSISNSFFLSVLLYISNYYLLHEMIQIRVGVASGILLLSIKQVYNKNFIGFLILVLTACFFHYSSILFLPLYLVKTDRINTRLYIAVIIISYIIAVVKLNLFNIVSISSLSPKIELYLERAERGEDIIPNIWSPTAIINTVVTLLILLKSNIVNEKNKYVYVLLKCNVLSIVIFLIFLPVPVFSVRLSELFGIVQLCLFPAVIYVFREKIIGYGIVVFISLFNLFKYFYLSGIFRNYYTWWQL